MILGVDPTVDYAFKHLLGRDPTRPILIDVINCVLDPAPGHRVSAIELLNPFNPKETETDKLSILDIKARDQSGRQFNIEMQMLAHPDFAKRILYYLCKFHQQQLHEGKRYFTLMPTISISFVNDVLFAHVPDYHSRFQLLELLHHFPLTEDIVFHLLELPKFTKTPSDLQTGLDIWLYFLRHAEMMDTEALPAALQQPLVLRAMEELKMLTQSDVEREQYEARRKAELDYNSLMWHVKRADEQLKQAEEHAKQAEEHAKQAEEHAKQAGEHGFQKGVEQGVQLGIEQGRQATIADAEKAAIIRFIHLCERSLSRPPTAQENLASLSTVELTRTAEDLEQLVQKLAPQQERT